MSHSRHNEKEANFALERRIKQVMHGRQTRAESTRMIAGQGNAGLKPDVLITAKGRAPVIIEAEYSPARNVEEEARDRLGRRIRQQTHPVESVIALRYPDGFEFVKDIDKELAETKDLEYCAVYPKGKRFPTTGWLTGSVCDLADLIHLVDVPETAFERACDSLIDTINAVNSYFTDRTRIKMPTINKIFKRLGLTEDPKAKEASQYERRKKKRDQTARIAGAIIANALLFQERISQAHNRKPFQ